MIVKFGDITMLVLDIPRPLPDNCRFLSIPLYHRPHIGLAPDRTAHLCFIPPLAGDAVGPPVPQVLISTIDLGLWGKVWRLTMFLKERPGLVHAVSDTLRRHQVNILAAESGPVPDQYLHQVELIFCCDASQLPMIEWTLLAGLREDLAFYGDSQPRLRIQPMHDLQQAKRIIDDSLSIPGRDGPAVLIDTAKASLVKTNQGGTDLRITLPKGIRDAIKRSVYEDSINRGYYVRVSDTRERIMRFCFFKSSDPVIHCALEHKDDVGSLATITGALEQAGFSILSLLHVPAAARNRAVAEMLLYCASLKGSTAIEKKDSLCMALKKSNDCLELELKFAFPRNYSSAWQWRKLKSRKEGTRGPDDIELGNWIEDLGRRVNDRHKQLGTQIQRGLPMSRGESDQWNLINRLIAQDGSRVAGQKTLFVSCHYKGSQLRVLKETAEHLGFVVLTGEHLESFRDQATGLVNRLGACSHFIGVWSLEGAIEGDGWWPSPWLLWELGVAEALGLKWKLLIDKSIRPEAWQKIHASHQHILFDYADFAKKLDYALTLMKDM